MSVLPVAADQDAVAARALRKATLRLIPLIALGYGTAYMDRVNISFAALQMNRDLHFSASVYGLGAGLFFLSYAALEIPSNLALYRFGARRWLARIMITWGVLAIGMALVRTPWQFYTMRFLLGMAEAGFFPGVIFYLTQWFPAHLRARAVSRFYVAMPLSSVVMGAIAGGLLHLNGRLGLAGWQWLFLVEGLPAIVLSVVFLFFIPDGPADAAWLTEEERASILGALEEDRLREAGHDTHSIGTALLDWRVWLMSAVFLLELGSNYAYTLSAPAILTEATHASATVVGWLLSAMNLVGAACMIFNAIHSDRTRERYWHVIVPFLLMAVGFACGGLATKPWLVVPALALTVFTYSGIQGPLWAIPGGFLKGRSAAAGIATINMIGMLGGFIGPAWMGVSKDATGSYRTGLAALTVPCLIGAGLILYLRRTAQSPG
ncbi:MFS transporter [Granulicella sp. WH15]|uniref:MFS transporter n=1 Tax=Granulicella sp. WH15 TaxID=2602070 RepID=UPI001366AF70|nr:MFS transporter [Granulicella sp. WH15]QHN05176.1 MFS transporter [Granulicella sp. WH15]